MWTSNIKFNPRWREELVATSNDGILIFELTMGKLHVYFPDQNCWNRQVPVWAQGKWAEYKWACESWCMQNGIPISIVNNALVYEERQA